MRELHDDDDLYEMYVLHKRKPDVLLWVYGDVDIEQSNEDQDVMAIPRKRQRTDTTSTKRESIAKTLSTVEEIVQKLKDKHGANTHSIEQFNCWAHMINSGKWSSYEEPPDFPFFKKVKPSKSGRETKDCENVDKPTKTSSPVHVGNSASPMKRLNMRTQCIDQLGKWHVLLESEAISQSQYEEMRSSIIDDMKKM